MILNKVHGNDTLSCWNVGEGMIRIQSRDAKATKMILNRFRKKGRKVGYGTTGGYLQVFQVKAELKSIKRWVKEVLKDI